MKTLQISEETYEKIREQLSSEEKLDVSKVDDLIGEKFFIRTVTYHLVGKLTKIIGNLWQLEDASWVADSGRFMNAIKNGSLDEVEPVGDAFVNSNSIVDIFPWKHDLPKEQK
jgi:hypothetical protein